MSSRQKILIVGDGYRAKNSELSKNGLPFARGANINQGFLFDDAECLDVSNLQKAGEKISRTGDVVFTSKGTVGRFAFVGEDTKKFVYSPQLCYWRVLDEKFIHPRYLYFWMYSREFFEQYNGVKNQTDMADYVSLINQRRFHITLPPIEEQKAIAKILSSFDDKIELNRKMNATLEAIARALFKAWFVDFEPVRANAENRPPESASPEIAKLFPAEFENGIPKSWRFETIDLLTSLVIDHRGKTPKKLDSNWSETGIPAISAKNIKSGRLVSKESMNYVDENLYEIWMPNKLKAGDVLMTSEAPLGELLYLAEEKPLCLSQRVFALRANKKIAYLLIFIFS